VMVINWLISFPPGYLYCAVLLLLIRTCFIVFAAWNNRVEQWDWPVQLHSVRSRNKAAGDRACETDPRFVFLDTYCNCGLSEFESLLAIITLYIGVEGKKRAIICFGRHASRWLWSACHTSLSYPRFHRR
jgi:hypothetical protein